MLFVKPVASGSDQDWCAYMTMNNEFYKSIHSEISRIADERELLYLFEIRNWMKKRQSQQIDNFALKKVNVIVINPSQRG